MSVTLALDDLLAYSDHERAKWRAWLLADPSRLDIVIQDGGRFPTAASLLDHLFLVERRHLARLENGTPPESTGIPAGDVTALFEYGELVRRDFRRYLDDLTDATASESMEINLATGRYTISRRKLSTHIVLHEVRHLAQLALAARMSGHAPPGDHDYLFFP